MYYSVYPIQHHGITLTQKQYHSHQVGVKVESCRQVPRVVLLGRPTVNHKETDPILKVKPNIIRLHILSSFFLLTELTSKSLII